MSLIKNRINSVDSLRGIAAIVIVLYHARLMLWTGLKQTWNHYGLTLHPNAWLSYASFPISFGGLAVSLFFVISGYCIHRRAAMNLATNIKVEIDWKQYALRRFWRIYPLYVVVLCVTAVIDTYLISSHYQNIAVNWDHSLFSFCMSLLSLQGLAAPTFGSNGVFWTLAIELHLYLVYPILFYISRRYGALKSLSLTFGVSLIYLLADIVFGVTQLFPHRFAGGGPLFLPYWVTWGFGFYIAEVEAGRIFLPKKFWSFAVISSILTIILLLAGFGDLAKFTSTLILGGLLWWSINNQGKAFWDHTIGKLLARVGIFSYSLYAIHIPCLFLIKAFVESLGGISTNILPAYFGTIFSLFLAFSLFILVEQWSLKKTTIFNKLI